MLEAISREDEAFNTLLEIIEEQRKLNPNRFRFFDGALKEIKVNGLEQLSMLSLYEGHIVGYMGIVYNEPHDKVVALDLAYLGNTITEQKEYIKDFSKFCGCLDKLYKKIEISIVPESPAYSLAMKFFKRFNFRKVGTFKKTRKIDSKFYDVEWWEKEER